ncbi:MAG TPA: acyl-CoA dehydrogenase, partial [Acidimicrobiia bacterium]|nr:acyl-CoA dehydrogenase [Acidimicrobiia bacterium]
MIDYSTLDAAMGHNWYDLDPDLQARVRRDCPPEDYEWADAKLHEFGGLVGERVAPNSEVVDAHPPELRRYDQWADEVNEIVHHPAGLDSKRALWTSGYVGGFS